MSAGLYMTLYLLAGGIVVLLDFDSTQTIAWSILPGHAPLPRQLATLFAVALVCLLLWPLAALHFASRALSRLRAARSTR